MINFGLKNLFSRVFVSAFVLYFLTGCPIPVPKMGDSAPAPDAPANVPGEDGPPGGRLVMFVGVDISGSFMNGPYFKDSLRFLAHYIYAHLHGLGGMTVPSNLFVGSIGGAKLNEPKTFYPIQTFQHRSVKEIEDKLVALFPTSVQNPFTDYNAFFEQISVFVKNRKMILKPIMIVMLSDGKPDAPNNDASEPYRGIKVKALENLTRDLTLRVLYTTAIVGMNWQTKVPRDRVKIWSQDDRVMRDWKDPHTLIPGKKLEQQTRWFGWVKDNVDFPVPRKPVK
jgi:hypothetical protein